MKSPFKFLDSYTKEDHEIFFGREREIEELYHRVFESKIMLVYGVSGTGKSSLIHCGLANKFQETDWLPLVIRRGGNMLNSLSEAIRTASITSQSGDIVSASQFRKAVKSLYLDHYKPVFFIFDQFEELFIFGNKDEKKSFIQIIKSLFESEIQCRFIFVMREEYMAGFTEFEKYMPSIFQNRVRIEKMSHINAIDAIKGPCKVAGIDIEEGFAEKLLEKLSPESADVELTYLQVFLDRILKLANTEKPFFSSSLLFKVGNVSDLLGSFLDEQISLLSNPDTGLAVLKSFVSVKGTKKQMTSNEVSEYSQTLGKIIPESLLQEMLLIFINLRILRDKDQNDKYELRHDALATKIYEKISLVEKEILEIRQFIENAYGNWHRRSVLLSADDLNYIAPYESRLFLQENYKMLIERSKNKLLKAKRRRRNIVAAVAALLIIVLSSFTFWAVKERGKAVLKERQSRANSFNFLSKDISLKDPTVGLQIAQYANELDPHNESILENMNRIYYDNTLYKKSFEFPVPVYSVKFSPGIDAILLGTVTNQAILIDILHGLAQQKFTGHHNQVRSVSFSPDGKTFLTGSKDQNAILWDLQGHILHVFSGHSEVINSVAFSPDGERIFTGSADGTARMWSIKGELLQVFLGHKKGIWTLAVSPDGNYILTGSNDFTARLWDLHGKMIKEYKGHEGSVRTVAFSPDCKYILTGSGDKTARLWDINGNTLQVFRGHTFAVYCSAFSRDGKHVFTGSDDYTVRMWDLKGNTLQVFKGHTSSVTALDVSNDDKTLLTGSMDGTVKLWDIQSSVQQILKCDESIRCISFSPDRRYIITGSDDQKITQWDLDGHELSVSPNCSALPTLLKYTPDDQKVIVATNDGAVKVWELNNNKIDIIISREKDIASIAISHDGKKLLTGAYGSALSTWDFDGTLLKNYPVANSFGSKRSVAFSPTDDSILVGSRSAIAYLIDKNGNLLQTFKGHSFQINSVAYSPDGKTILTGSSDATARLWDLKGNILKVFSGHDQEIYSVAFSPDGKSVLTGSLDNTARLWNLRGETMQIFKGHEGAVMSVAFSPDGQSILTGSVDKTARIWKIKIPFDEFIKSTPIEKLTTKQLLKYGMMDYDELKNSGNTDQMYSGIVYYLNLAEIQPDPKKRNKLIDDIIGLLKKVKNINKNYEDDINFSNNCTRTYNLRQIEILKSYIRETNERIISETRSDTRAEFTEIYFYNQCFVTGTGFDSTALNLGFPESEVSISKIIVERDSTKKQLMVNIGNALSDLSYNLLLYKKFKLALESAKLSYQANKKNDFIYTNLPLCYLFNNQYENAAVIYKQWMDKPWTSSSDSKDFRGIFLDDINTFERKGITHPDFAKVKELLKK
jgi:WD40 repeat protein